MDRRSVVQALALAGAWAPVAGRVYRIGYLGFTAANTPDDELVWRAFVQRLRELGYTESGNLVTALVHREFSGLQGRSGDHGPRRKTLGRRMSEKEFARLMKVQFTPSLLFMHGAGRRAAARRGQAGGTLEAAATRQPAFAVRHADSITVPPLGGLTLVGSPRYPFLGVDATCSARA